LEKKKKKRSFGKNLSLAPCPLRHLVDRFADRLHPVRGIAAPVSV